MANEDNISYDCEVCGAKCCKYVCMEIDEPSCRSDYDNIRWYLRHRDVHVFIDHEDSWCIEFKAVCDSLDESGRCQDYDDRPKVCRKHGDVDECDLYHDDKPPYKVNFETCAAFEEWLDANDIKWRYKGMK
ncbi:hypothetical protein BVX97_02480 [bacterium E08(2017)]|nr:hypothetical protein BVX97_02480 [bacterium E08(2017)]